MSTATLPLGPLSDIAARARSFTGGSGAALALGDGNQIVTVASAGDSAPEVGAPLSLESGIAALCFRTGTIQICNDAETDDRVDAEACRALRVRSIAAVPIKLGTQAHGVLAVFAAGPNVFDGNVSVLTTLADIVAELIRKDEQIAAGPRPSVFLPESDGPGLNAGNREPFADHQAVTTNPEPTTNNRPPSAESRELTAELSHIFQKKADVVQFESRKPAPQPEVLSWAEDPGPSTFRVADALPSFAAMPEQPERSRPGLRRWLLLAATCSIVVLATAAWLHFPRGHAGNAGNVIVAPVAAAPALAPAGTATGTPLEPTASPAEKPEQAHVVVAPSSTRVGVELPRRQELNILLPRAHPKPAEEPEVTAPVVAALGSAPGLPATGARVPPSLAVRESRVVPAQLIKSVAPQFPQSARNSGMHGKVVVSAVITKKGMLANFKVESGMYAFFQPAVEALKQWRYQPATLNGEAVESAVSIELKFEP